MSECQRSFLNHQSLSSFPSHQSALPFFPFINHQSSIINSPSPFRIHQSSIPLPPSVFINHQFPFPRSSIINSHFPNLTRAQSTASDLFFNDSINIRITNVMAARTTAIA